MDGAALRTPLRLERGTARVAILSLMVGGGPVGSHIPCQIRSDQLSTARRSNDVSESHENAKQLRVRPRAWQGVVLRASRAIRFKPGQVERARQLKLAARVAEPDGGGRSLDSRPDWGDQLAEERLGRETLFGQVADLLDRGPSRTICHPVSSCRSAFTNQAPQGRRAARRGEPPLNARQRLALPLQDGVHQLAGLACRIRQRPGEAFDRGQLNGRPARPG